MELIVMPDSTDVMRITCRGAMNPPPRTEPLADQFGVGLYGRRALLNLAEANYIDSGGVSWLIICHKRFMTNGGRLVVYNIPPLVRRVLDLLNLKAVLHLATDESDALNRVQVGFPMASGPQQPAESAPAPPAAESEG